MRRSKFTSASYKALQFLGMFLMVMLIGYSCSDINVTGPGEGKTKLNVHLTDAPGDYQEVNINVQGLRVHYTPFDTDTTEAESESEGKWIDLPVDTMMVDLLKLQNGVDTLLTSAELEPGYYRELRLVLGEGNNVVIDSTTHQLKVPSGQSSGYKVKFEAELEDGEVLDVTIDFDAHKSVHKAGNSGKYILNPVLKAMVEGEEPAETGSITGTIEPLEANPSVYAIMEGDTAATVQPDTVGVFLIEELNEGTYELVIDAGSEAYQDSTVSGVSVTAGNKTDIGTVVLEERN